MYGYIFSLVRNRADAEDLLQETSITLREKFEQFDPETDFIPWAFQWHSEVKNFQRKQGRSKITFTMNSWNSLPTVTKLLNPVWVADEVLQDCLESSTTLTESLFYLATNPVPTRKQQQTPRPKYTSRLQGSRSHPKAPHACVTENSQPAEP